MISGESAGLYPRFHDAVSTRTKSRRYTAAVGPFARSLRDLYEFLTSSLQRPKREREELSLARLQTRDLFIEFAFLETLFASAVLGRPRYERQITARNGIPHREAPTSEETSISYSIDVSFFFLFFSCDMRFPQRNNREKYLNRFDGHSVFRDRETEREFSYSICS